MSNYNNDRYILQNTRPTKANEFIFTGYGDRRENQKMWRYLEEHFGIAREKINEENLPLDRNNDRMFGFRIIKTAEVSCYQEYND